MNKTIEKGYITFYNGIIDIHDYKFCETSWHEDTTIKTDGGGITVTAIERKKVYADSIKFYNPDDFEETPTKESWKLFGFIPMKRWTKKLYLLKATKKVTYHSKTWKFTERI